jgi:iron(III) transport system ATP-binding protein
VALMRAGRLVSVGKPEDLYRRPQDLFSARFFCQLNEIVGTVRGGKVDTPVGLFLAPGLAEGVSAVVAVRPQGIRIRPAGLCIPARLEQRRFLGEVELLEVAVHGLDATLKVRARDVAAVAPKSEIGIEIDPAEVLVFAASDA